jgi:hypothetical protein
LASVAALAQVDSGREPVKLVRKRSIVNVFYLRSTNANAKSLVGQQPGWQKVSWGIFK